MRLALVLKRACSFRSAYLSSSEADLRLGSNCRPRGLEFPMIPPHIATGKGELSSRVSYWGNSNTLNYHVVKMGSLYESV
ncbi:hypothetical protein Hanom_Chr05g00456541 [Helianthus anomalus]